MKTDVPLPQREVTVLDDRTQHAIRDHLAHLHLLGFRPSTVYYRSRLLIRLAHWYGGSLLDMAEGDLYDWRAALTVSDEVVVKYVGHVREFYTWAHEAGLNPVNPALRIPTPRNLPRRLPRPVGEEDLAYALEQAPDRVRPWLVLAAWEGLRACEIASLERHNVLDTADPPLLVVASAATKGRTERCLPLHSFVVAELRRAGLPRAGYVFRRHDGRPGANTPARVSHLAGRHLKACGVPATLHMLRHRFATRMYALSGCDLRMVQELLGHRHINTTAGYAALDGRNAREALALLEVPGPRRHAGGVV